MAHPGLASVVLLSVTSNCAWLLADFRKLPLTLLPFKYWKGVTFRNLATKTRQQCSPMCVTGDKATRRRVHVHNITFQTTQEQLYNFFTTTTHAKVEKVILFPARKDQQGRNHGAVVSNGQGVVTFAEAEVAQGLIAAGTVSAPGVGYARKERPPELRYDILVRQINFKTITN